MPQPALLPSLDARVEVPVEESTARVLVQCLGDLGVRSAFGVSGGGIAHVFDALAGSPIALHHFRHESGAAFAASEAYFASGRPTAVFATTGPGVLNAVTGLVAAKWDGAKVVMISGSTSPANRGRWATQETSGYTMPEDAFYGEGPFFDFAVRVESPTELPLVARRLAAGLARPGGFVAHVSLPLDVQACGSAPLTSPAATEMMVPAASAATVETCADLLSSEPFAIWLGFGATQAAEQVRELVERTGAPVLCSPRAKGILPEDHPQYLGVTGIGGHDSVTEYLQQHPPSWILVLGSRLGEATSFWDAAFVPRGGFIHVDLDPRVPGVAYPDVRTLGVQAEIGQFVADLLPQLPEKAAGRERGHCRVQVDPTPLRVAGEELVRPQELMRAIQSHVVEGSDALVVSDCGNSFVWCNHYLSFTEPGRYRVNTLFGSMGHFAAGVVGAALARQAKTVAVVGDGSMLMNSEISTAVNYRAPAVWIVLNDGGYQICRDGHQALGLSAEELEFTQVDFVALARSMGADGARVDREEELSGALRQAMASEQPFVLDVRIDTSQSPPLLKRFRNLARQSQPAAASRRRAS